MRRVPLASRWLGLAALLAGLACSACGGEDGAPPTPPAAPAKNPLAVGSGAPRGAQLWELEAAPSELQERIQAELGKKAGVRVVRVPANGAAATAGVRSGDVLLAMDGAVVLAPAEVDARLHGRAGAVSLTLLRVAGDGAWSIPQVTLTLPAAGPATPATPEPAMPASGPAPAAAPAPAAPSPAMSPPVPAPPAAGVGTRADGSARDIVTAYFDMLDFARTEGWERRSATPEAVRQHATALLEESWTEIDAPTRAVIREIPGQWAALRQRWDAAQEAERQEQRAFWRDHLLLPNPLLPPTGALTTFRSEAGHHTFEYPAGWVLAQTRVDDTGMLYLAPAGTQTTWEQVVVPSQSPPGVLFAIAPTDEGLRAVRSPEEGARYVAQAYVTGQAPAMREIVAFRMGTGALVAYVGRWPGHAEDSFVWVAAMPFGNDKFLAGRFSGPVAQAEVLLPDFSRILATTEVTPPDDLASLQVSLAASIIGNAVVNTGWSH